jgi:hypothetical protein
MEAATLNTFLEKCLALEKRRPLHKDMVLFFRGENEEHKHLIPSIYQPRFNVKYEDRMFREVVATFPGEMLAKRTGIEKLTLMQRYEPPTRILDISKNLLVGIFFACYREQKREAERDGRVYVFAIPRDEIKFCDSDSVCLIANICKRPADFSIGGLPADRDSFNDCEAIEYLIHDVQEDKPHFKNLALKRTLQSVICLNPLNNNERIKRQNGYFFLFGIKNNKTECAEINPAWIIEKIRIPAATKPQILKDLDFVHINESALYNDYHHLSNALQEKYSEKSR